jgi:hypothetical protein
VIGQPNTSEASAPAARLPSTLAKKLDAAKAKLQGSIRRLDIRGLGGKLFPIGWLKLLWRLKISGVKTARMPLMGVKRKYANGLLGC